MKKLLLVSCLLGMGTLGYAKEVPAVAKEAEIIVEETMVKPFAHVYFKVGADIKGIYEISAMGGEFELEQDSQGYEVALEGTKYITSNFEMGLGLAYQNHGKGKGQGNRDNRVESYESVPVYMVAKYNFDMALNPYVKAVAGYSFNSEIKREIAGLPKDLEIEDGAYYGVGLGIEVGNFYTEAMYQITKSEVVNIIDEKIDTDYERVTVGVGYKF